MLLVGECAGVITDCGDFVAREAFLPCVGARGCHEDRRSHGRDSVATHRQDQSNGSTTSCLYEVGTNERGTLNIKNQRTVGVEYLHQ